MSTIEKGDARRHLAVQTMLDISMAHMPEGERIEFTAELRSAEHDNGWIVFVSPSLSESETAELVPEWLLPIWQLALAADCILINFDADAGIYDEFRIYE